MGASCNSSRSSSVSLNETGFVYNASIISYWLHKIYHYYQEVLHPQLFPHYWLGLPPLLSFLPSGQVGKTVAHGSVSILGGSLNRTTKYYGILHINIVIETL